MRTHTHITHGGAQERERDDNNKEERVTSLRGSEEAEVEEGGVVVDVR